MNLFVKTLIICIITTSGAFAQNIFQKPLSNRCANYDISVKLDVESKILDGKLLLKWINTSPEKLSNLQFHLYMNAFKNSKSTFMRESVRSLNNLDLNDNSIWGWIDIISMKIKDGENLTSKIKFIQPDDNNSDDQTVINVQLSDSIKPGDTLNIEIVFLAKLPKIIARTGYSGDYFLAGQWFPKIGVFEYKGIRFAEKGQWNCHQYHANTEFYSDFGVYNVDITVPRNYKLGATGILQKEEKNKDGTKTLTFRAEDVIDFAWTASPSFIIREKQWNDVKICALMQEEHQHLAERHINAAIVAMEYMKQNVGDYPYPNLTIVDPPLHGIYSGGMEYPCFIVTQSVSWIPKNIRIPELFTIHEFVHNFFMGIIANNETEEPWLDEGITTYFESRILDETFTEKTGIIDFFGIGIGATEYYRSGYTFSDNKKSGATAKFPWTLPTGTYTVLNYNKPATWLHTLERMTSRQTMDEIFKTYYENWKFKHPTSKSFIDIVNETTNKHHGNQFGYNLNWFFQQVLYGTDVCDYKLAGIENYQESVNMQGVFDKQGAKITVNQDKNAYVWNSKVIIHREGEILIPTELLVHFTDDSEIIEKWDGQSRVKTFYYEGKKIKWAKIDPYNKILIDINLSNNSRTVEPDNAPIYKYTVKFLYWLQSIMQAVSFLA